MNDLAISITNLLLVCGFPNVFPINPSALDCGQPIVVAQGAFSRDVRMEEEERGSVPVTVLIVREVSGDAEDVATAAERAIRRADWEPYADAGAYKIVGLDTTAPVFKERDSSGRFVWSFEVVCTVARAL